MNTQKQTILDYIRITLCEKQPCSAKSGEDCTKCKLSEAFGLINKMEDDACFAYELNLDPEYCQLDCLACIKDYLMSLVPKYLTNGDKIRKMKDEELAELLDNSQCAHCAYEGGCDENAECSRGILEWLQKDVDEDDCDKN